MKKTKELKIGKAERKKRNREQFKRRKRNVEGEWEKTTNPSWRIERIQRKKERKD